MGQTDPVPIDVDALEPAFVREVAYIGGAEGDDVSVSTAAVAYATNGAEGGAAEDPDYEPKTQAERATMLGVDMAEDITTPRGWIDPLSPATEKPDDPTLASIAPTTGAAGVGVTITLTGTGFSRYSTVKTGGVLTPYVEYVDPETLKVRLDPRSTAGSIDISVIDHSVETAPQSFTFT
jgi:hypothetical protein